MPGGTHGSRTGPLLPRPAPRRRHRPLGRTNRPPAATVRFLYGAKPLQTQPKGVWAGPDAPPIVVTLDRRAGREGGRGALDYGGANRWTRRDLAAVPSRPAGRPPRLQWRVR